MMGNVRVDTAFVLAGGLGTRLRSVVQDEPKCMARIRGRPFLEYLFDYWIAQGLKKFVVSIGYLGHQIIDHFGLKYGGATISYAFESQPLGTGGAFVQAKAQLPNKSPFLVLNGDTIFRIKLDDLTDALFKQDVGWILALTYSNESGRYRGVHIESDRRVTGFSTETDELVSGAADSRLIFAGVSLVDLERIGPIAETQEPPFSLEIVIEEKCGLSKSQVGSKISDAYFLDIGIPSDYASAQTDGNFFTID